MSEVTEKMCMKVLKNFFSEVGIVSHQIDTYNYLVNHGLQKIFDEVTDIVVEGKDDEKYLIKFGQVYTDRPCIAEEDRTLNYITPMDARTRDIFYEGHVCVDIVEEVWKNEEMISRKVNSKVSIAKIPVMIRSCLCNLNGLPREEMLENGLVINIDKECYNDPGGYFIIKGKERVLISQERINYNQIYVFAQKPNSKFSHIAEIRSMSEETGHSVLVQAKIDSNGNIVFSLPYIKEEIPAAIAFKALGFSKHDEIADMIHVDDEQKVFVESLIRSGKRIETKEDALTFIGEYSLHVIPKENREKYAMQVLENELFPHMGVSLPKERALLLGHMLRKLIDTFTSKRPEDDRDNISMKRVESAGVLIGDLFRMLLKRTIEQLKKLLTTRRDVMSHITRINNITTGLRHCFSVGNWGIQKNTYVRTGVSQILSRLTYSAMISHLRRVVYPTGKEGKNTKIRQLHPTQYGYIDPAETPEGHAVGIVKNLAMTARITVGSNRVLVRKTLEKIPGLFRIRRSELLEISSNVMIFLNGVVIGSTEEPEEFVKQARQLRSEGVLDKEVSISYDPLDREILVYCDEGRLIRPFFTVDGETLVYDPEEHTELTWEEMVDRGIITWVDSNEVENSVIATYPQNVEESGYDYCEIHPSTMLGVVASTIPYPDHSQAPRNCYSSSMTKQAIGTFALNHRNRTDTIAHVLHYTQKPVVQTQYSEMFGYNEMPYGINVTIAVACYAGFNQEDSVIINKSAVDRGLFVSTMFRNVTCEEKKPSGNTQTIIDLPPLDIRQRGLNYAKLDEDGIIPEGLPVEKGDVIVGKVSTKTDKDGNEEKTDCSLTIKAGEEGVIDKVFVTTTSEGYKMIKIKIRSVRTPEVGDKFASRAGQKGTCGMMFRQEDMPMTEDGIVPDVIINPHAFPSRMTINQLMEMILGKKCAMEGTYGDSTPFTQASDDPIEKITQEIISMGLHDRSKVMNAQGYESMINGMTGELLQAKIFMGVCYYQRLKHMVSDKIHARSFGDVTVLSRQPLEGRSRDGGLRCGEMERDALISHGASAFLRERLFNMSDPYRVNVCEKCGNVASNPDTCKSCEEDRLVSVNIPYACKLLLQELNAMGIKTSIMPRVK